MSRSGVGDSRLALFEFSPKSTSLVDEVSGSRQHLREKAGVAPLAVLLTKRIISGLISQKPLEGF